jgi:hypothetical protein
MIRSIFRVLFGLAVVCGLSLSAQTEAFAGCECPRGLNQPTKGACERKRSGRCISGYRSSKKQAELYRRLPRGQAAKPGTSNHERGLAIDLAGTSQCPPGLKRLNSKRHKGTHCSPTGR